MCSHHCSLCPFEHLPCTLVCWTKPDLPPLWCSDCCDIRRMNIKYHISHCDLKVMEVPSSKCVCPYARRHIKWKWFFCCRLLGAPDWAATLAEEDLGLLMNEKLTSNQQCASVALEANYQAALERAWPEGGTVPICGAAVELQLQCCTVDHTYPQRETNWRESSTVQLRQLGAGAPESGGGTGFVTWGRES